jgi:hypothetical protein
MPNFLISSCRPMAKCYSFSIPLVKCPLKASFFENIHASYSEKYANRKRAIFLQSPHRLPADNDRGPSSCRPRVLVHRILVVPRPRPPPPREAAIRNGPHPSLVWQHHALLCRTPHANDQAHAPQNVGIFSYFSGSPASHLPGLSISTIA